MRENLPDLDFEPGRLFNMDQLQMDFNFDTTAARSRITLDEDFMDGQLLIPLDAVEMFDQAPMDIDLMTRLIDQTMVDVAPDALDINLEQTVQGGVAQAFTSTAKKRVSFDTRQGGRVSDHCLFVC